MNCLTIYFTFYIRYFIDIIFCKFYFATSTNMYVVSFGAYLSESRFSHLEQSKHFTFLGAPLSDFNDIH